MFFLNNAKTTRANARKNRLKREKAELKFILHEIRLASNQGYTSLKRLGIKKVNKHNLKQRGYKIKTLSEYLYEISW